MTLVMFVGMTCCLPMAKAKEAAARRAQRSGGLDTPLLGAQEEVCVASVCVHTSIHTRNIHAASQERMAQDHAASGAHHL